jgi:hypothetical protein
MTATSLFVFCLTWCKAHPAQVALATSAVASCFVSKLDKYPRMHALFSLLSHAGVNVPGVVNAVTRLVTGQAVKVAAVAAMVFFVACATITAQDRAEVGTYEGEQAACVVATPHDTAAIDACRAKVKAEWCAKWAARFDAGVCQ